MKSQKLILIIFASLFLIILAAFDALACSCRAKTSVLEEFDWADLVVIAKAVSVEMKKGADKIDFEAKNKKAGYDVSYQYLKSIKMRVDKVYKGNVKVGDNLTFISGDGVNCGMTFGKGVVGDSFLFYLHSPSQTQNYAVSFCGRSQKIVNYETDDLKYLNNLEKVKGKTRISGEFNCWWTVCPDSLANLKVIFTGENKTYETQTDDNGIYEIYDLPVGKYFIKPEIPKGWKINQYMLTQSPAFRENYGEGIDFAKEIPVIVENSKHTGVDFYFDVDTAIRGKVLSPQGKPMENVCLKAVSTELKEGDYRGRSDCTNKDGIFIIDEMPPEKYILVANSEGKLSADEPFKTLFYPNTTSYSGAKSFEIKLGDHLDGFVIQVPKIEETVTVEGKLIYSNSIPVANEWLEFDVKPKVKNIDGEQRIKTDKNGNFRFKVLKGYKGILLGKMYIYESKFKNCPQLYSEIPKQIRNSYAGEIKTDEIAIDATKNISSLALKFNIKGCEKVNE